MILSYIDRDSRYGLSAAAHCRRLIGRTNLSPAALFRAIDACEVGFEVLELRRNHHRQYGIRYLEFAECSLEPSTPIALGHLINHPSDPERPDLKPNVMVVPYEFSRTQGQKYAALIPNHYVAPEKFMYKVANNHVLPNSFMRV